MLKRGPEACPVQRVPAAEIEAAVIDQLRGVFRQPDVIVGTWHAARVEQDNVTEEQAREALVRLHPLWDELFPAEQARIVQLLIERVEVRTEGVEGPASAERTLRAGAGSGGRQEGSSMNIQATLSADGETITIHIPMTFKKRGGWKAVVTPHGAPWAPRPRVDNALVKALARAFRWRKMLGEGMQETLEELARAKGLRATYVSRRRSWSDLAGGYAAG